MKLLIVIVGLGRFEKALLRHRYNFTFSNFDFRIINVDSLQKIAIESGVDSSFFSSNTRGYGFWMWKPVVVNYFLQLGHKNILYLDAGCDVHIDALSDFIKWFVSQTKYEIVLSRAGHNVADYTKQEVISELSSLGLEYFKNVEMAQGGVLLIKNTTFTINLFCQINDLIKQGRIDLFDDISRSTSKEDFSIHRHDQSVLNIFLLNQRMNQKIGVFNSSFTPPLLDDKFAPPLIASRNYSIIPLYWISLKFGHIKKAHFLIKILLKTLRFISKYLNINLYGLYVQIELVLITSLNLKRIENYSQFIIEFPISYPNDHRLYEKCKI